MSETKARAQAESIPTHEESYRRSLREAAAALERIRVERDESRLEVRRLQKQVVKLTSAVKKMIDLGVDSDVVKGGLGGRTAIESYRGNIGRFMHHMYELGVIAAAFGHDRARLYLQTTISADFHVIFASAPATDEEGKRRADAEWMITSPAAQERLLGTGEASERARARFINLVLRSGVDTSTYELVRRSGEMPIDQRRTPREDPEEVVA
jgi:hypothetical protein